MTKANIKRGVGMFLCIVTVFILLFASIGTAAVDEPYSLGDLTGDGKVDIADARLCLRIAVNIVEWTYEQRKAANVIGDGICSISAARHILRYAIDIIDVFPVEKLESATWEEFPLITEKIYMNISWGSFDLKYLLTGYDSDLDYKFNPFIFKGTIISLKNYKVTWADAKGKEYGPYIHDIIEVQVNKEYYGESPVKDGKIKIYSFPLATDYGGAVDIKENNEYIFVTQLMDNDYIDFSKTYSPSFRDEPEKYADVFLGSKHFNLLPVVDGNVLMHNGYFNDNEDVMKKVLPYDSVNTGGLLPSQSLEYGYFIALKGEDFEREFYKLLESVD